MAAQKKQAEQWKAEAQSALHSLSLQIDRQFSQWTFSKAEKEVV